MRVKELYLRNFRNYGEAVLSFGPALNILYGDNAEGKTNVLEALFFLATSKSHRAQKDAEMIRWNEPSLLVRASVERAQGFLEVEISCDREKRKSIKMNGSSGRRVAQLLGKINLVFFSPDDLELVKGAPSARRRFLNVELSQTSPQYFHALQQYQRAVFQRNSLLKAIKEGRAVSATLPAWDAQVAGFGAEITARRARAIERMSGFAEDAHARLASRKEKLAIQYLASAPGVSPELSRDEIQSLLLRELERRRGEELARAQTVVGPHRDDLLITINGTEARVYGSQGQQRTAVLALKLAELEFIRSETGEEPLLLLDDVASELDPERRRLLLDVVAPAAQTFVTCTHLSELDDSWIHRAQIYRVRSGVIELEAR